MGTQWTAGTDITSALLNQYYGSADTNITTVTAATTQNLSSVYTIPAAEPSAGSAYELVCGGSGTWGSTQQTLQFSGSVQGSAFGIQPIIQNTAFAASAGFRWYARILLVVATTGAGGTGVAGLEGCLTQQANNILPGTAADNTVPFVDGTSGTVALNTTTTANIVLKCQWGSTTGSPTISNRYTIFRKIS